MTQRLGLRLGLARASLVAAALFAPAGLASDASAKDSPATKVMVDRVATAPVSQTVPVIGRLVAKKAGEIAARISGPVAEFRVSVGDRVEAGDVLAVLDTGRLRWERALRKAEVEQFSAALKTAKESVSLAEVEMRRQEKLRERKVVSEFRFLEEKQRVAVARSEISEAQGELARAKADLQLAEISIKDATVRALYPGVITVKHTEEGAFVNVGDPLVSMVDHIHLEIEADVPSRNTRFLTEGRTVPVKFADGGRFFARVRAVIPDENPQTRTRAVRFTPVGMDGTPDLAPNQSVTLDVPSQLASNVVSVHKDAVLNRPGGTTVMVALDGKAEPRIVQLGDAVGSRFIVVSGLKAGDLAIVRGNERLRPGETIDYVEPPALADRAGPTPDAALVPRTDPATEQSRR